MEYITNNKIGLTYSEYVDLFGLDSYKNDKRRNNITVHGLGGNGRKVYIEYETLKENRKEVIRAKYGNPYEYLAKTPVLNLINWDYEAQKFYEHYVLPNGLKLPACDKDINGKRQINYVDRYTRAASWLNMLASFTNDKKALKRELKISLTVFWDIVTELIRKEEIGIPGNAKRLREKLRQYQELTDPAHQYELLIEKFRFGNENAKKIKGEAAEAVLLKLLSDPRKHDYTVVAAAYNKFAESNGQHQVTPGAIGYFKNRNEHILSASREGKKNAYSKYSKHIQRDRASAPLLFVNADDNCLDLFFETETWTETGGTKKSKYYRPMLYVITDTYNDYILGYAFGDRVTHELIYEAFRNAMNHIQVLTGNYYLPHQLQTDRWGLDVKLKNKLAEFYSKVAIFTPQAHGVPQGKYIERSFGVEWHQVLKAMPSNNYAGKNITAKERLSAEYVVQASKDYPKIEEMPAIVETFINVMRMKPNPKSGVSRQKEWLEAFNASEKSKVKLIDTALKLQLMGKKRAGEPLTLTASGLRPVLEGKKISLDIPDQIIYEHHGKKVEVVYDPQNLSEVLITDGKGLRFVASPYQKVPAAIADYQTGDRERIGSLFEAKKQIGALLTQTLERRVKILDEIHIDPQSLLQAGVLIKDLKQGAETLYLESQYQAVLLRPKHKISAKQVTAGKVVTQEQVVAQELVTAQRITTQEPEAEEELNPYDFY
jgi:hypothetical protein